MRPGRGAWIAWVFTEASRPAIMGSRAPGPSAWVRADARGDRDATILAGPVPRRRGSPRAGGGLVGAEGPHPTPVPDGDAGGQDRGRSRGDDEGPAGACARRRAAAG